MCESQERERERAIERPRPHRARLSKHNPTGSCHTRSLSHTHTPVINSCFASPHHVIFMGHCSFVFTNGNARRKKERRHDTSINPVNKVHSVTSWMFSSPPPPVSRCLCSSLFFDLQTSVSSDGLSNTTFEIKSYLTPLWPGGPTAKVLRR